MASYAFAAATAELTKDAEKPLPSCSPSGLVLVDVFGAEAEDFYKELRAVKGLDVQRMDFAE